MLLLRMDHGVEDLAVGFGSRVNDEVLMYDMLLMGDDYQGC
jgi:hypothetical protein